MTIFDRIDFWLMMNKVSRRQLATKAGLPPTSLQSVLTRRKTLSHDMLDALANAMGVTVEYLLRSTQTAIDIDPETGRVNNRRMPAASVAPTLRWLNADGSILCPYCGSKIRMVSAWQKTMPDMGGLTWCARGKCTVCGSLTPEMYGRTAKEANAAAYAAAQWGHVPLTEPPKELTP